MNQRKIVLLSIGISMLILLSVCLANTNCCGVGPLIFLVSGMLIIGGAHELRRSIEV